RPFAGAFGCGAGAAGGSSSGTKSFVSSLSGLSAALNSTRKGKAWIGFIACNCIEQIRSIAGQVGLALHQPMVALVAGFMLTQVDRLALGQHDQHLPQIV